MSLLLKDILLMAENRLTEERCLTPRLDAELLFCHMMQKDRSYLFLHYGDLMDEKTSETFFQLVDVRASGMPVQYMTGQQEFMGLTFRVNEDVLIPRQDTETLVEAALTELRSRKTPFGGFRVLDLCCGSGAISISLCHHLRPIKVHLDASDLSGAAVRVARENAVALGVEKQVQFRQGDLFEPFPKNKNGKGKQRFDYILSNPPYIKRDAIPGLMREIRDHEPLMALDGGEDGMDFYIRILNEAPNHLKSSGKIFLEIGYDQGEQMISLAEASGAYESVKILQDLSGRDRVAVLSIKP